MKVLHLATNIASQMKVTVDALRALGIETRGLTGPSPSQNSESLEIVPWGGNDASFMERKLCGVRRTVMILKAIAWADVIHWHFGPGLPLYADLQLASLLGRKKFVEFWGSDIRDPEIECADNPWYAKAWESGEYECREESHVRSQSLQGRFSRHRARLLINSPGMAQYVRPAFFPDFDWTAQRICVDGIEPCIPSVAASRPLVVHAPTAPGAKGTRYILAAVEKLKGECEFDFQLIHGMPHHEAKEWIRKSDIFIDQLICGDYGLASVEAMAMGKPVICYIKPSLRPGFPPHFPVINANPDTVENVLRDLLKDGPRRRETGERSRAWAEERHEARRVVAQIAEYYRAA
jgi:hypothetical protein